MELDLRINSKKRYEMFINKVPTTDVVWGLQSKEGWCACPSNNYENAEVMPFWSEKSYAMQCAIEEWKHYKPTPIPLEEFLYSWLSGMNEDNLLVGVNWNSKLIGLEVEPTDLFNELQNSMKY